MATKETIITASMLILITYTLSLSLVSQAYPAGQTTAKFSSTGTIQIQTTAGIGVYSNAAGTTALTSLPWGTLAPGGSSSTTIYIKNEGSSSTTLSLNVDNWYPTDAPNHLSVTWDYSGDPINAGVIEEVTLTLSVSSDIHDIETFGFDVTIVGSSS